MSKETTKRNDFVIPDDIAALFGYAPTLKTEDDETYWKCMERVIQCVEPQDIIEWLWLKDVVDLSWEILRLRRLKIDLVEIDREDQNATIEWEREHATPGSPAEIEARQKQTIARQPG